MTLAQAALAALGPARANAGHTTFLRGIAAMRDPELVTRAQRAAARLESAWERWRALQGLGETPAQPVVGYVGYGLNEPWGQPRAVIGFSAEEAERLAEFLEHDSSDHHGITDRGLELPPQRASGQATQLLAVTSQLSGSQLWHS